MRNTFAIGAVLLALVVGSAAALASGHNSHLTSLTASSIRTTDVEEAGQANQTGDQGQVGESGQVGEKDQANETGEHGQANETGEHGQSGDLGEKP